MCCLLLLKSVLRPRKPKILLQSRLQQRLQLLFQSSLHSAFSFQNCFCYFLMTCSTPFLLYVVNNEIYGILVESYNLCQNGKIQAYLIDDFSCDELVATTRPVIVPYTVHSMIKHPARNIGGLWCKYR